MRISKGNGVTANITRESRLNRLTLQNFILITVGAVISAISVIVFQAPFQIAPGGISGIAIILNHLFSLPIGLMVLLGNIPIQVLGFRMLGGWKVVAGTVYYLLIYSILIDVLTPHFPREGLNQDIFLNALFGGIIGGIGAGLVYRAGGTVGGTSTLGRILQTKFGMPLSTTSLYTDSAVILAAGFVFGWDSALYAMVALFVAGAAADYVLEGPSVIRTAVIVTDFPTEVAENIMSTMQRGVTSWQVTGMFTEQAHTVLYVTVGRAQINELRRLVFQADPKAFMVIGQGHSAFGQGFREMRSKAEK